MNPAFTVYGQNHWIPQNTVANRQDPDQTVQIKIAHLGLKYTNALPLLFAHLAKTSGCKISPRIFQMLNLICYTF